MPKPDVPPITDGRIVLRLLEERDLPMTLSWRNQDDIRKWFLNSAIITPEQHRSWWERYRNRDDDFVFVIEERVTLQRPVGQVGLYHIDREQRTAEFGRLLIGDREAQGHGLGSMASRGLLKTAFSHWNLRTVYLEVRSLNRRAIALYRSCGFVTVSRTDAVERMLLTKSSVEQ